MLFYQVLVLPTYILIEYFLLLSISLFFIRSAFFGLVIHSVGQLVGRSVANQCYGCMDTISRVRQVSLPMAS